MVTFKPAVTLVALCSLLLPLQAVGDGSSTLLVEQVPEENSTGTSDLDVRKHDDVMVSGAKTESLSKITTTIMTMGENDDSLSSANNKHISSSTFIANNDQNENYNGPTPKMLGDESSLGSDFSAVVYGSFDEETIKSKSATFTGRCSSDSPFEFIVGGKAGRGAIGAPSTSMKHISIELVDPDNGGDTKAIRGKIFQNFFTGLGSDDSSGFAGLPFKYNKMTTVEGSKLRVTCVKEDDPVDIVVFVADKKSQVVEATVTHELGSNDQIVNIVGDLTISSKKNLRAEKIVPVAGRGKRILMSSAHGSASPTSIILTKDNHLADDVSAGTSSGTDVTLVQMMFESDDGMLIPRTIPILTHAGSDPNTRRLQHGFTTNAIRVEESTINKNGDITFRFQKFKDNENETSLLQARIGIRHECGEEVKHIVDMSAMLAGNEPTLVVHAGWFRRATEIHSIDCEWEPVLVDVVTKDPEDGYAVTGRLEQPVHITVMKDDGKGRRLSSVEMNKRRKLLKATPSPEEIDITQEMRQGRKPERPVSSREGERRLSVNRKKILVHGYCASSSPFTFNHFSDAIEFSDPDTSNPQPSNWSHDLFARKIWKFTEDNNIDSCGIIAHSQGGLASLHLWAYYYSCLDNAAGGERLIQSIGSPYQGSPLAGFLAFVGQIFGASCGWNEGLTIPGASYWLSTIPYARRSDVYYRTTSVKDYWWSWDACSYVTDFFLWDPEDGATERHRGQLPGGQNAGHTEGLCHTLHMNNPGQTANWGINNDMNSRAKY